MTNIIYTSKKEKLQLAEKPFASGGEGAIYKVLESPSHLQNVCVKIYHPHIVNEEREKRIKYMAANPPRAIRNEGFMLGWPMDYVTDKSGKFLGFVEPLGFPDSKELTVLTATNMSKSLDDEWVRRYDRRLGKPAIIARLKLIKNIAIPVHILHDTGKYVLKDFKPQNVMATKDGRITMVDMDSIQIVENGKLLFPGTVATPEYMPPEFYVNKIGTKENDIISQAWDTFSLGVVFYQLLFGIHPYVCTPQNLPENGSNTISNNIKEGLFPFGSNKFKVKVRPKFHDDFLKLPQEMQKFFISTFSNEEDKRASAKDWGKYVHRLVIREENGNTELNGFLPLTGFKPVSRPDFPLKPNDDPPQKPSGKKGLIWGILIAIIAIAVIVFIIIALNNNSSNYDPPSYPIVTPDDTVSPDDTGPIDEDDIIVDTVADTDGESDDIGEAESEDYIPYDSDDDESVAEDVVSENEDTEAAADADEEDSW